MRLQNQLALQGLFLALRAPQAEEPTLLLAEACSSVPGWLSILRIWASPQGVHPPSFCPSGGTLDLDLSLLWAQ